MINTIIKGTIKVTKLIDSGGMGEVYEAVHLKNGKKFAIKFPHKHLLKDEEFIKRFTSESKIACLARNKNIVKGYGRGRINGLPYLIMEYVNGLSLKDYLAKKKRLHPKEALNIINQIARALDYLYRKKLIRAHRDLKPSNLLVASNMTIKLMDFGVVKTDLNSELTKTRSKIGAVCYASPEQIKDPKRVSISSDIWSLGVMFYELLSGEKPFDGANEASLFFQILYTHPRPLAGNIEEMLCWGIISKQLMKNPEKRTKTPRALLLELSTLSQKLEKSEGELKAQKYFRVVISIGALVLPVLLALTTQGNVARNGLGKLDKKISTVLEDEKVDDKKEPEKENVYRPFVKIEEFSIKRPGEDRTSFLTCTFRYFDRDGNEPESVFVETDEKVCE
ncbi:MAG: serine/threonine protein kinase, partial [Actinomycetia bacterium]|nr:serine/threonine protein kinase [Actinomycetes bacterium]